MPIARPAALAVVLLAAGLSASSQPLGRHPLEGTWTGDGLTLKLDPHAWQANKDPLRLPFAWESFQVRNAVGSMVVFMVGPTMFIGNLDGDTMTVTRRDRVGTWSLSRGPLYPPTTRAGPRR